MEELEEKIRGGEEMLQKNSRKIIFGILSVCLILNCFVGCKKQEEDNPKDNEQENSIQQQEQGLIKQEKTEESNNGGNFVAYQNNIYYREYANEDIEEVAPNMQYVIRTDSNRSKYINVITPNGEIKNLFKDDGYGNFYICDDRFFFHGAQDKLYTVDFKGKNYIELCKGQYLECLPDFHKIYYINKTTESLYELDTQTLKITKLDGITNITAENGVYEFLKNRYVKIVNEKLYYIASQSANEVQIEMYDFAKEEKKVVGTIHLPKNNSWGDLEERIFAEKLVMDCQLVQDRYLVLNLGMKQETTHDFISMGIYSIDLEDGTIIQVASSTIEKMFVYEDKVFYYVVGEAGNIVGLNEYNLKTQEKEMVTTWINAKNTYFDGKQGKVISLLDETENVEKYISKYQILDTEREVKWNEEETFPKYQLTTRDYEQVGRTLFFVVDLSRFHEVVEGYPTYERVASEVYKIDFDSNKRSLVYVYRADDKKPEESSEAYEGIDKQNEPLAENEMYLEIKLADKGAKDTFSVRVEEVGGMIIGKRIEYEGVHKRTENILKIKVTKEIGAMLTVYIDDVMDTQMLIEE